MANKLKYRTAWSWPQQVEDFIRARAQGFTVHVASGQSSLGDVRIDRFVADTDIRADFLFLPLRDEVADTVVSDPPWMMDYQLKPRFISEVRRITKFGGLVIINAPWCPKCPGLNLEEIWVPVRQLMTFNHISLIFVLRKIKSQLFTVSLGA